jgi:hypothetical protein
MMWEDWSRASREGIEGLRQILDKKAGKKYQLDLLDRLVVRVEEYSGTCQGCRTYQEELTRLIKSLEGPAKSSREDLKKYRKSLLVMTSHLGKIHKLKPAGTYVGIGLALGTAIGVALGTALQNIGAGIGIGTGLGVVLGGGLEARAKREGTII